MADEKLSQQAPFAGTEIQDTDLFLISIDNLDATFSSRKISGLQIKDLIPTLYSQDGSTGASTRTVTVTDALHFLAGDANMNFNNNFIGLSYLDGVDPDNNRVFNLNVSSITMQSKKVSYLKELVYSNGDTFFGDSYTDLAVLTPIDPNAFCIKAKVKAFCSATADAAYFDYIALYQTISGVTTLVGAPTEFDIQTSTLAVQFVIVGNTVKLQVAGVTSENTDWTSVVTVF